MPKPPVPPTTSGSTNLPELGPKEVRRLADLAQQRMTAALAAKRERERNQERVGKREATPTALEQERPPIRQHVVDALARAAIAALRLGNQVSETAAPAPNPLGAKEPPDLAT